MSGVALGWLALVVVLGSGVLWFRRAFAVRLPRNRSGFVAAFLGGALLGVVALLQGAGWLGGIPAVLAIAGGCFVTFTVAISRQEVAGAISVGAQLPDFSAPDENGDCFAIASVSGRPLLLKFFRGHW